MLELNREPVSRLSSLRATADEPSAAELLAYVVGVARRQMSVVLLLAIFGAVVGAVFFLRAAPTYTATATLLVDTHKIDILQQQSTVSNELSIQSMGAMESQVELLRSNEVALAVIKKFRLWQDPRFVGNGKPGIATALVHKYFPIFSPEEPPSDAERMEQALKIFDKSLTANRIGVTYAIEIAFEARYPDLAAQVAYEVADEYIDLQRASEYGAARQASDWLETRIPELRAKSEAAQRAVISYKQDHNIVETTNGQLINEERVADLNLKLNAAHDDTLKAKAKFDQFSSIGSADDPVSL